MKKYLIPLLIALTLLTTASGFAVIVPHPATPYNCFRGFVYSRIHQPISGVTVELFSPGGESETFQTNDRGEYWFCRPFGGWTPGNYLIKVGCCEQSRSRSGDGNIYVDFITPCFCK